MSLNCCVTDERVYLAILYSVTGIFASSTLVVVLVVILMNARILGTARPGQSGELAPVSFGRSTELFLFNELSILAVALCFVASDHATGPATEPILASALHNNR